MLSESAHNFFSFRLAEFSPKFLEREVNYIVMVDLFRRYIIY
jgi:hypothetical protein